MSKEYLPDKYKSYEGLSRSYLIGIKNILENIKIKKERDPLRVEGSIREMKDYLEGFYISLDNMKKELNLKPYKNKEKLIKDLYNILENIENEDVSNNIKEIIKKVQDIYNILDNMKKEPLKILRQNTTNTLNDAPNDSSININKNLKDLNYVMNLRDKLQNLDNILNNMKSEQYIDNIIYNISELAIEFFDIHHLIDRIKINQIPNPDNFIKYIGLLIEYAEEINRSLESIRWSNILESKNIKKKIEKIIGNIYFDILNTTSRKVSEYINNFTYITNGKYGKYRNTLINYLMEIYNVLQYMKALQEIESKYKSEYTNKIKGEINKYLRNLSILKENIKEGLGHQHYKSIRELIEDIDNNLEKSNIDNIIRKVEGGIVCIEIIDTVINSVKSYIEDIK